MSDCDSDSDREAGRNAFCDDLDERGKRKRESRAVLNAAAASTLQVLTDAQSGDRASSESHGQSRNTRGKTKHSVCVKGADGTMVPMTSTNSPWCSTCVVHPKEDDDRWLKKFRRRFRVPCSCCRELLGLVESPQHSDFFGKWSLGNKSTSPASLLLLGSLCCLGRGWTFDDLEEATGISEEVHRLFFHAFVKFGEMALHPKFASIPSSEEDAQCRECEEAGLPGCVGSVDATHVLCEKIPHDLAKEHEGFKLPGTARACNVVVINRRKTLSTTKGHPARWNDKTLVRHDEIAATLRHGKNPELDKCEFFLHERVGSSDSLISQVERRCCRGAWLLVDNGCLNWSCTVPPMKTTDSMDELRFSKWVESLRKDVECTFGTLKARFRVLKVGVRLHGISACDRIWATCCALHDMVLEEDGLDIDDEFGTFDPEEISEAVPLALRRLHSPGSLRSFDASGMGRGNDVATGDDDEDVDDAAIQDDREEDVQLRDSADNEGCRRARFTSVDTFRKKLIEHFDIMFHCNMAKWPRSLTNPTAASSSQITSWQVSCCALPTTASSFLLSQSDSRWLPIVRRWIKSRWVNGRTVDNIGRQFGQHVFGVGWGHVKAFFRRLQKTNSRGVARVSGGAGDACFVDINH